MEGDVPAGEVLGLARRFADLGVRGVTVCDTTGMEHPNRSEPSARHCSGICRLRRS